MIKNYDKEMERIIADWTVSHDRRPRLLLHSCCAPCSSAVLERLAESFDIVDYFYNPNISPAEEYTHRVRELKRLVKEMGLTGQVEVTEGAYDPGRFYETVKGLEGLPEGGQRCTVCFRLRLEEAAKEAKRRQADYFTTTLSISPHKDAERLNRIGREMGEKYGVPYLYSDFKKRDGYKRSILLSRQYGLYRQDYCGCIFSKEEARLRREIGIKK